MVELARAFLSVFFHVPGVDLLQELVWPRLIVCAKPPPQLSNLRHKDVPSLVYDFGLAGRLIGHVACPLHLKVAKHDGHATAVPKLSCDPAYRVPEGAVLAVHGIVQCATFAINVLQTLPQVRDVNTAEVPHHGLHFEVRVTEQAASPPYLPLHLVAIVVVLVITGIAFQPVCKTGLNCC